MTNFGFYALQDTNTGIVSMFSVSVSDEYAIQFYLNNINEIFNSLKEEKQRIEFLRAVHHSKVVRLADIDAAKPEVTQNLAFIADFNDLVVNNATEEEKQKEKEI